MTNNRFALLILSLVSAAGVWAVANVPSVPLAAHKFALNDGKFKVQNIANGNFPANPMYAAIKQYADAQCSELYFASSYLLDTCMSSATTSVQYTCGMKFPFLTWCQHFTVYCFRLLLSITNAADGVGQRTVYSDATCTTVDTQDTLTMDTCSFGAKLVSCGSSDPNELGGGDYAARSLFQAGTCTETLSVNGMVNNKCYPGDSESFKYSWPNLVMYSTSDSCSGTSMKYNLEGTGCIDADDDADDYTVYGAYSSYSHLGSSGGDSSSLSTGAIVGIVIGAVAFVAIVATASWCLCCRTKTSIAKRENEMSTPSPA
jgi:hypothetical protein